MGMLDKLSDEKRSRQNDFLGQTKDVLVINLTWMNSFLRIQPQGLLGNCLSYLNAPVKHGS